MINHVYTAERSQAVLDLTGGHGVEHVIEVGGLNTLRQNFLASRAGARVALFVDGAVLLALDFAVMR